MSSLTEEVGLVAAAVAVAAAGAAITAVYGVGWTAWQAGKLVVDANRAIDRQIAEKKHAMQEAARHREMKALAAHDQLVDMCSQVLEQLEKDPTMAVPEMEQLKLELKEVCTERVPSDVAKIESITSLGYLKLEKAVRQQNRIAEWTLSNSKAGTYNGLSVANLMDELRIAITAMEVQATTGADVKAVDLAVLERVKLNEAFVAVSNRIVVALEDSDDLTKTYGLTDAASAWLHSCFNGVDGEIAALCKPTTTNAELKKGVRRLEERMESFDLMATSIEKEAKTMQALYEVYVEASKALCEPIESVKSFKSSAEIEEKLKFLQTRAAKAEECAKIYQKLGPSAYLCYAWDRELQAMGYGVHSRKEITELASKKPQHATMGENKLPFYQWENNDLTQLYSITEDCDLQVIVHEDGKVTMETFVEEETEETIEVQRKHCSKMAELHERLRKNWFIYYDHKEIKSPELAITVEGWRTSKDNAWGDRELIVDQRTTEKSAEKAMRMN